MVTVNLYYDEAVLNMIILHLLLWKLSSIYVVSCWLVFISLWSVVRGFWNMWWICTCGSSIDGKMGYYGYAKPAPILTIVYPNQYHPVIYEYALSMMQFKNA